MDASLLLDPIFLVVAAVALWVIYRFSGIRTWRLRRQQAALHVQATRETNPSRRRELLQQWSELGGPQESKRTFDRRRVRDQGQKARVSGKPRSANPYPHSLWGRGRLWKLGWKAVDRNIKWIETQR